MQPGGWRRGVMFRSGIRRLSDRRVRPQYRPNGKRLRFFHSGNAFDTSSEPGVVWVMQDVNGNGEPDDEWYELRGSETGKEGTVSGYAVTYYRPAGRGWTYSVLIRKVTAARSSIRENFTTRISIIRLGPPILIRCAVRCSNPGIWSMTGFWINRPYDWGYADNYGSDCLAGGDAVDGKGQSNGFRIANAMQPDGTPVELKYIDFVKVQVGVNAKSGPLGEVSTEVFSFADLSIVE